MKTRTAILSLVVFLLFSIYAWAEWYPGIIHVHTAFSDGSDNIPRRVQWAQKAGAKFLVVTDHYEQINERDNGFEDYIRNCREQTNSKFVTIPGAEITSFWSPEPEQDNRAESHTLAIGPIKEDALLLEKGKNPHIKDPKQQPLNTQKDIIKRLVELRCLPVAAHPALLSTTSFPFFWEWRDNRYDRSAAEDIKGIEMFNTAIFGITTPEDENWGTISWYLDLIQNGKLVFVTSGCDSHRPEDIDITDPDRWTRKTWVFSEKLEAESLLEAIAQGRTYAANYGASFESLNYIPGFQAQEVDQAKFDFRVVFERETVGRAIVRIYRDGNLAFESETDETGRCTWEDEGVEKGREYQYTIVVQHLVVLGSQEVRTTVLITSPTRLKIRVQPLVEDWKEYKIGALSYSVPADWKVGPEAEGGVSRMYYTDRGQTAFMVGVMDAAKGFESGKWRIVHYGMNGGKKIEELGTTSRTISIGHMGRLVDSFKAEIAGRPVTVCVLHLTGKEGMPVEGKEFTNWSFVLIEGGKHYAFTLAGTDPAFQRAIFKQLVSRIRFLPKID